MKVYLLTLLVYIASVFAQDQSFYKDDPNIIELTPSNFDRVVHNTNYTTLVEFYAPWCGYCKQLKNTIHSLGKASDSIFQVAAVNCDKASNKQLCGEYGVEGFPTLKVFKPGKAGKTAVKKHASETYMGERKLAPLINFIKAKIKNHVKKLTSAGMVSKLVNSQSSNRYAVVLFSKQSSIPVTYKSIAIDWLDRVKFYCYLNTKKILVESLKSFESESAEIIGPLVDRIGKLSAGKDKSLLVLIDKENQKISVLEDKITKSNVAKFIIDNTSLKPKEGPYSKRDDYLAKLKLNKKKKTQVQNDEL